MGFEIMIKNIFFFIFFRGEGTKEQTQNDENPFFFEGFAKLWFAYLYLFKLHRYSKNIRVFTGTWVYNIFIFI